MRDVLLIGQPAVAVVDPHLTTDRRATLAIRGAEFEALARQMASQWAAGRGVRGSAWSVSDGGVIEIGGRREAP